MIEDKLGDPILIGINLIVFGLVLEWADRLAGAARRPTTSTGATRCIMGVAQALALAPGVSRSGVTISAGRWLRFDRESATRLVVPDEHPDHRRRGALQGRRDVRASDGIPPGFGGAFFWGIVASGVSGFLAIAFLLRFVRTHSFRPFVIYRVVARRSP